MQPLLCKCVLDELHLVCRDAFGVQKSIPNVFACIPEQLLE